MGCIKSKLNRQSVKLTHEDMDFLKLHTNYTEDSIKEWFKGFKQDCPNGQLTLANFVHMYMMFFPTHENAGNFLSHVFRSFDTDDSGYLDFKEFLVAIDVISGEDTSQKLQLAFRYTTITPPIPLPSSSFRGFSRDVNKENFETHFLRLFRFKKILN